MKIADKTVKKLYNDKGVPKEQPKHKPPPLSLSPEKLTKEQADLRKRSQFHLYVNPSQEGSQTYKFNLYHVDGTETLRAHIQWYKDIHKIIEQQLINEAENQVSLVENSCEGAALAAFQDSMAGIRAMQQSTVDQIVTDTEPRRTGESAKEYKTRMEQIRKKAEEDHCILSAEDVENGLKSVIEHAAPWKVLQKQKRYMRRYMRKPRDMNIRNYINQVTRINNEELVYLPPFRDPLLQKLTADEVTEIVINACPNSWIREMERQDFDPEKHTLKELLDFLERIEALDPHLTGAFFPMVCIFPKFSLSLAQISPDRESCDNEL
jgi:uncharacterized protein YukE